MLYIYNLITDCTNAINIQLENDDELMKISASGLYIRSSDVNDKPSYEMASGNYAIWYNKSGSWMIGRTDFIGASIAKTGDIFVNEGGLFDERSVWHYFDENEWKTAGKNDVTVECIPGTFVFLQKSFPLKYTKKMN